MITRTEAVDLFGSTKALQEALELKTRSAIYMWPKDGAIPENAYLKIRYELRPGAFDTDGNLLPRKSEAA